MSDPITPHEVESEIMRLNALLDRASVEMKNRGNARTDAKLKMDHGLARAVIDAQGRSIEERKAKAHVACEALIDAYEVAEQAYKNARDAAHNIRAQLDALRSINANVRHQAGLR